jgi:hypothetical protein
MLTALGKFKAGRRLEIDLAMHAFSRNTCQHDFTKRQMQNQTHQLLLGGSRSAAVDAD